MKFNQSAIVSEVLNVLKTAAEEDNFDGFKVDPSSIKQVSTAPTDTTGTTFCLYFYGSCNWSRPSIQCLLLLCNAPVKAAISKFN